MDALITLREAAGLLGCHPDRVKVLAARYGWTVFRDPVDRRRRLLWQNDVLGVRESQKTTMPVDAGGQ